jgi:tRNA (guanine37-N1)-methyltransferase
MRFHVVTLFPEAFSSYLASSIVGRALREEKISVAFYNPRDFTKDKHRRVDRRPYGGGPGMVLEPTSVLAAAKKAIGAKKNVPVIFFSPAGKEFTGALARTFARKHRDIVFIAGHYEGVDARVARVLRATRLSVGPYVLSGGELPALVVIDAIARQIPGVLGNEESLEEERSSSPDVYTRPATFTWKGKRYSVPKVLRSGHHKDIEEWKRKRREG